METVIRAARSGEAADLTRLCVRSKAYWGYDAAFMALTEATLYISEEAIGGGRVVVAADLGNRIAGVAAVEAGADGAFNLSHLFVEPDAIGRGIGRKLLRAAEGMCRRMGGRRLVILSDPNAEAFYQRLGAYTIGDAPSDAIPGRRLPMLELRLGDPMAQQGSLREVDEDLHLRELRDKQRQHEPPEPEERS